MRDLNPCMVCCAYFRTSFYLTETDDGSGPDLASLTEPVTSRLTLHARHKPKGILLRALRVASVSRCTVRFTPPSTAFVMSGRNSEINNASHRARAYCGLPSLYKDMLIHTEVAAATLPRGELQSTAS